MPFALLSIAALTSTIATAEVPIAYAIEQHQLSRRQAAWIIAALIAVIGSALVIWFEPLFNWVVTYVTQFNCRCLGCFILLCWVGYGSAAIAYVNLPNSS